MVGIIKVLFYLHILLIEPGDSSVLQVVLKYFKTKEIGAVNLFSCRNNACSLLEEQNLKILKRAAKPKALYQIQKPRAFLALNYLSLSSQQQPSHNAQLKNDSPFLMSEPLISIPRKGEDIAYMLRAQHYVTGIAVDLSCRRSFDILDTISRYRLFNGSYAVALIAEENEAAETVEMLEPFRIALDSDITIFTSFDIVEVHRIQNGWPLISTSIGQWNSSGGLTLSPFPPRWDLNGSIIKAVTVIKEFDIQLFGSKEFFDYNYHPTIDGLSRHMCSINRYLEIINNFRTNLTAVPDWGYLNETAVSFDKHTMFGLLEREETELGLTASWLYSARAHVARFSPTFHLFSSSIVFRHPPAGASLGALAKPLSPGSWLILFTFMIVQFLCLYSIRNSRAADEPLDDGNASSSLLQIFGIICLQGSHIEPIKIPTRILSLTIQVMALMIYSYYGATIVGFLLLPTPRTITSVDRLLDTNIDLWVENASLHKQHFKGVVAALATKYYEVGIKKKNKFIDRTIGLRMVQKGGAALYGVTTSLHDNLRRMFTSSEICSLQYLDILNIQSASAIMKFSPYREVFIRSLIRLQEHGFADYEERKWHPQRPTCVGSETNAAVKLEATFISLVIFTVGFLLALTFFAIELNYRPRKPTNKCKIQIINWLERKWKK